jgi:hypothetical protein
MPTPAPSLPAAVPAATPAQACPNCGLPWLPQRPRFCPACGQETNIRPPRIGEFIQQFGGAYFATEGALWRTLKLLLFKPGELTRQYLTGRRKHYVLPLRLYLTISVLTLLLLRLVAGLPEEIRHGPVAVKVSLSDKEIVILGGRAGMTEGAFHCTDLPAWLCQRLKQRIDLDPDAMAKQLRQVNERFIANLGNALFVMLPCFALWLKLVYRNRGMHYTEHLVFALHVHAFWFVALAFTLPDQLWLSNLAFTAIPWYTMLAMRRVYGGRRWPRFLRAGVVSLLYGATLALALVGLALWAFLF